ncbi:MAG: uracil-DNA glycosylase [Sphingomonadales bacterium]|jgi:uracil-DNA glycosylase family 4|nr:uracil-DNA glycosylase [Sphingomonadales bacterium]
MPPESPTPATEAPRDCPLCPRLVAFRHALRAEYPDWWNAPVPNFGDPAAWLAICGLAPGKHGANRTGRPFTGDFAGLLLYETLLKFGLAEGRFEARPDDGLRLRGVAIVNSVKCVPPQNKPTPAEITTCTRNYFQPSLQTLSQVRILVALGRIGHDATVRAMGGRLAAYPFAHLAEHRLPDGRILIDSYHCSRYNQNTGRLTAPMFEDVFARALELKP